jgi:hypothetical protein
MVASPAVLPEGRRDGHPLKRSFANFQYKTWTSVFGNKPTRRMYEVGEFMAEGPDKQIDMGFRGLAKSYTVVDYCLFELNRNPQEQVLTVAGEGGQAKGNAALAWFWLQSLDFLAHLRPTGELRRSAQAFDVQGTLGAKSESFAALSLFGSITGRRGGIIVPDDIETPNTAETETKRAQLRERAKELGGAILKPGGRVIMLGTPQTEETIYLEYATEKGYSMRIWPVLYPTDEELVHYGPWLSPSILKEAHDSPSLVGTSTEPTRFTEADLFGKGGRRDEYGLLGFRRQFLLWTDVGGSDEKPLRLRDCPVVDIPAPSTSAPLRVPAELRWSPMPGLRVPNLEVDSLNGDSELFYPLDTKEFREWWQTPEQIGLFVDPSGGGKDETAWGVVAQHSGRLFVLDQGSSLDGFSVPTLVAIARMAAKWKVQFIECEKNFGGGMFGALLKPHLAKAGWMCSITEEFATGQKELRIIDSLEGLVGDHRLVFSLSVLTKDYHVQHEKVEDAKKRFYRLTYQFTRITREKGCLAHDDRLDWLSKSAIRFQASIQRTTEDALKEAQDDFLNKEVAEWIAQQEASRARENPLKDGRSGRASLGSLQKAMAMTASKLFRGRSNIR